MLRRICQLLRDDNEQGKTCKIEIADLDAISGNLWSSQPRLSICSLRPARVADIILLMPLALSVAIIENISRGSLRISAGNASSQPNHIYKHSCWRTTLQSYILGLEHHPSGSTTSGSIHDIASSSTHSTTSGTGWKIRGNV